MDNKKGYPCSNFVYLVEAVGLIRGSCPSPYGRSYERGNQAILPITRTHQGLSSLTQPQIKKATLSGDFVYLVEAVGFEPTSKNHQPEALHVYSVKTAPTESLTDTESIGRLVTI